VTVQAIMVYLNSVGIALGVTYQIGVLLHFIISYLCSGRDYVSEGCRCDLEMFNLFMLYISLPAGLVKL